MVLKGSFFFLFKLIKSSNFDILFFKKKLKLKSIEKTFKHNLLYIKLIKPYKERELLNQKTPEEHVNH